MSMPKGYKVDSGYATVGDLGGLDYRRIAEDMTESGFKMNHATARNVFLRAMEKIAERTHKLINNSDKDVDIVKLSKHPHFQSAIQDIMHDELSNRK